MAIEFSWYVEGQIAYARLEGQVNRDDLRVGNQRISDWLNETSYLRLHIIFDARAMTHITFSARESLSLLAYLRHKKMGCFTVFGCPSYLQPIVDFLGNVIQHVTQVCFYSGNRLADAAAFIAMHDPAVTLPETKSPYVQRLTA